MADFRPAAVDERKDDDDYRRLRASLLFTPAYSEGTRFSHRRRATAKARRASPSASRPALASEGDTKVLLIEAESAQPSLVEQLALGKGPAVRLPIGQASAEADPTSADGMSGGGARRPRRPTSSTASDRAGIQRLAPHSNFVNRRCAAGEPLRGRLGAGTEGRRRDPGGLSRPDRWSTPERTAQSRWVGARIFGVVLNRRRSYVPAALQALL